jgi:hypothetical protein
MKKKKTALIVIISISLALVLGLLFFRFDRFKLIKCLKDIEKDRDDLINKPGLTSDQIISIERSIDRKRDECYVLYKP